MIDFKKYNNEYLDGFASAVPVILGYFFVSIGVGTFAVSNKMTPFQATLMSLTNLTSAGEISAVVIFGSSGDYIQLLLAQFIINIRYALMAISLSQKKYTDDFTKKCRFFVSFGITDEIFAIMANRDKKISPAFTCFLILGPLVAWTSGTLIGSSIGEIFSPDISNCMSILIYAMLLSLIVPEAKRSFPIFVTAISAALLSAVLFYFFKFIENGYALMISSVIAASVTAVFFPRQLENEENDSK